MYGTYQTTQDAFSCTVQVTKPHSTDGRRPCCHSPSQHPAWNGRFPPALADLSNGREVRGWEGKLKFGICT